MRKMLLICVLALALVGCKAEKSYETLADIDIDPLEKNAWEIAADLPPELISPVMQSQSGACLYMCDEYTLTTFTTQSGDLDRTLLESTGFDTRSLSLMKTKKDGFERYEAVWSAVSETGDQVGRIAILDDGNYHYVLTAMTQADTAGDVSALWQPIFRSFRIVEPGSQVNTGS